MLYNNFSFFISYFHYLNSNASVTRLTLNIGFKIADFCVLSQQETEFTRANTQTDP